MSDVRLLARPRRLWLGHRGVSCCGLRHIVWSAERESQSAQFCAIMSDSVGLYVGNPVTQMGYKIGTVDSITPGDTSVEVRFTIK